MVTIYKVLNNCTCVLISRQSLVVEERNICLRFIDAPQHSTVEVLAAGVSLYRELIDGECTIPVDKLRGDIKVTLLVLDSTVPLKKWTCEELRGDVLRDGSMLLCPNDLNLPQVVADLRIENDRIAKEYVQLKEQIKKINERIDKIYEAYKFI